MPDQDCEEFDFFDEIPPLEQGSDDRFANRPFDPLQPPDWQTGWHDADRDLRALAALHEGQPCPVCAAGEPCMICHSERIALDCLSSLRRTMKFS